MFHTTYPNDLLVTWTQLDYSKEARVQILPEFAVCKDIYEFSIQFTFHFQMLQQNGVGLLLTIFRLPHKQAKIFFVCNYDNKSDLVPFQANRIDGCNQDFWVMVICNYGKMLHHRGISQFILRDITVISKYWNKNYVAISPNCFTTQ